MEHFGFKLIEDELDGRKIFIACPREGTANGRWALKTEYYGAFPDVQLRLLEKGYHVVHIENKTRWNLPEDTDARHALCEYMNKKYGLSEKCVIIGMSCGGMQGIYSAAKYPDDISCMYLDAPVVNLLSCPAGLGSATSEMMGEFTEKTGMSLKTLISYRNHPLDCLGAVAEKNIPLFLVGGDSDTIVPFDENGAFIEAAYKKAGSIIKTVVKKGCDHHPHSLEDNTPIIDFILKYDK